jgi:hypothetical protein
MAFVPFDNVIKLEAVFTWGGQIVENVHHYLVDETPVEATCQALSASYVAWWSAGMRAHVDSSVSLTKIVCTILETESSPGTEYATGLPLAGTAGSPSLPNNVTVTIKWTTGFRGRSFRGRTYHIGLCESQVTGNNVTSTWLDTVNPFYGDLMTLATDVDFGVLAVASRVHNGVERVTGVATAVTNFQINTVIDSQRRRLPERGA